MAIGVDLAPADDLVRGADTTAIAEAEISDFQDQLEAQCAPKVVLDADYVGADRFEKPRRPTIVPARMFLSQLL